MNIETVRDYCLSLQQATEDVSLDESTLAFRIEGCLCHLKGQT